ncbi:MAG TPA: PBP1A family penicillin-binding protein [Gemmatimonadales bacterium]|nr:PBP1A family penicillin-binding protein [Gemmatimonadales bacterium]
MADTPLVAHLRRWFAPDRARRTVSYLLLVVGFVLGLAIGSWTRVCAGRACPSIAILDEYRPQMASKVYAMDDRLITELGYERRTVIPLQEMPPYLRQAFIAIEDKRFYQHHGIDYSRILGSAFANLRARSMVQGFSTITMQLARNVFQDRISREKTLVRKLREARVALELERTYSKDRILELYLNQISFNGAFGVEAAAQRYFGKSARDLSIPEAALLAALPKAPARYNPRRYPARAVQRRNVVLELMRQQGYLTAAQAEEAEAYPLTLSARQDYGDVAPYFIEWIREQLDARFGRDLYEKGYRIYTTLDLDMQQAAERTLEAQLEAIEAGAYGRFQHKTYAQYVAAATGNETEEQTSTPYLQGAMVAMDTTGAVRAMVGGRDFDDSKFNRATQAERQPGSTFKLFVYSAALRSGHSPEEMLPDSAIALPMSDGTIWEPHNFEQEESPGPITLRRALALSINLVTIRLGMELGVDAVVSEAQRYGLSTQVPAVPSMFIGSASVIPLEMVSAYTAPPTLGVRAAPFAVVRVEDADGKVLWEQQPRRERVMSTDQSYVLNDMLRDVLRYGTGAGAVKRSGFDVPAGGKSGTTNDYTDVWFIGYTHELVAGFWMGFDNPQTIKSNAQGGLLVAPAWASFMKEVYERRPPATDWVRPTGMVQREIDVQSGKLATPYCPPASRRWEVFAPDAVPTEFCPLHTGPNAAPAAPAAAAPAPPADGGVKPPKRPRTGG